MKLNALPLASLLVAAPAFAANYDCSTPKNEVRAFLVFDDGPGGLDDLTLRAWGQDYTDVIFPDTPHSVIEVMAGDTSKGTFEYGGDKLEIAFTAPKIKFEIFAKRQRGAKFTGRIVATGTKSVTTLNLTCTED